MNYEVIGITGGIGAGKSVVSRILRLKGYRVYDCDSEARRLMERSEEILAALTERFGQECILGDGGLDRAYIAGKVFTDAAELEWLNKLVHGAVRDDVGRWVRMCEAEGCCRLFVESAILFTSGLDRMCDRIWMVTAPEQLRLQRAMERGGVSEEDLLRRIESQRKEFDSLPGEKVTEIDNSGESLLERIDMLLGDRCVSQK